MNKKIKSFDEFESRFKNQELPEVHYKERQVMEHKRVPIFLRASFITLFLTLFIAASVVVAVVVAAAAVVVAAMLLVTVVDAVLFAVPIVGVEVAIAVIVVLEAFVLDPLFPTPFMEFILSMNPSLGNILVHSLFFLSQKTGLSQQSIHRLCDSPYSLFR